MHENRFIHPPPRLDTRLQWLGTVASITALSIGGAVCYEQYRKRERVRSLASMPGAPSILPALHANAEMLLAALGRPTPTKSSNDSP